MQSVLFFFQAEDVIRDLVRSRGLGDVYKRQNPGVPRVLFHELQYPGDSPVRAEVGRMIEAYSKRLALLFTQAKTAGELPPDLDATLAPVPVSHTHLTLLMIFPV